MGNPKESRDDALPIRGSKRLEIVEFCLGEKFYGISVMQVREIIRPSTGIVAVSGTHPSVSGVIVLRGKIIPVVNLARHLGVTTEYDLNKSRIIVSDFRGSQVGFWVHYVVKIHRISQASIENPPDLMQSKGRYVAGITQIGDKVLFILDFEKIASDINPGEGIPEKGAS